jgi:hypothetical protein
MSKITAKKIYKLGSQELRIDLSGNHTIKDV